jgi:hypothetical protein
MSEEEERLIAIFTTPDYQPTDWKNPILKKSEGLERKEWSASYARRRLR